MPIQRGKNTNKNGIAIYLCGGSKLTKHHSPYDNELKLFKDIAELDYDFIYPLDRWNIQSNKFPVL